MSVLTGPKVVGAMAGAALGDTYLTEGNLTLRGWQALVQANVLSITTNTPPGSPSNGDTYAVGGSPTGAWAGHAHAIAYWTTQNLGTAAWDFWTPARGWIIYNQADDVIYRFNGSTWVVLPYALTGGTSSGSNICALASPGTTSGFGDNKNCVIVVPAGLLLAVGTSFKLEFKVATGGSVTLINAVVRRTLPGTNSWLDSTPITWGSSTTPTFSASTTNLSDAISLTIDTAHDYYFIVYAAFNVAASVPIFNNPWGTGSGSLLCGTDSATNFTTVATPSLISGLGGSGNGISRVILA